jgi:hypothetical protein
LASGTIRANGAFDHPMARGEGIVSTGLYDALFHVGDWYRA